jgi:hypothetical protein
MSEVQAPAKNDETVHVPAEMLSKIALAYGDTSRMLVNRALAVDAAIRFGSDVKTIAADLAAARRADDTFPAVSEATLGKAKFAGTIAELIGTTVTAWAKRDPEGMATVIRAAKRVNIGPAKTAIRDALKPLPVESHTDRETVAIETAAGLTAAILPAPKAPAPKAPAAPKGARKETVGEDMSGPAALATVRAVTAWLATGGAWTPDLESALADLRTEATAARKRGATAKATRTGATSETPAPLPKAPAKASA